MSEHQEPSYYEIALTNRQVLIALVILLGCVMASFFAGVWVGKGSPAAAAAADVGDPPPPEATPAGETPEELSFFTEDGARPDLGELAERPRPDTTLAQDLGVEPPPEPTAAASAAPTANRTPAAGTPVPPAARNTPAPAAAADEAPATLAPGQVVIQVFSSRDEVQARRLTTRLRAAGFKAFLSPAGAMYRVRVGPFDDRREAESEAARARRDFKVDTWITASP